LRRQHSPNGVVASKFWVAFPLPRRYKDASILAEFYPKERCGAALPMTQQDQAIGQVLHLERLDSVAALMKNLQP
jgi:hypothetical protein